MERRCDACGKNAVSKPPKLNKKVIYLDQWVISNVANVLDPILRERKSGRLDPFWLDLFRQLDRLVKLQVIVCPESPLHHRESLVTEYLPALRVLYEHLSCEVSFVEPIRVHVNQLHRKFDEVVRGEVFSEPVGLSRVLHGNLNEWMERIRITASWPVMPEEVAQQKTTLATADHYLGIDVEQWRQHPGRSFAQWYQEHKSTYPRASRHCAERRLFGLYTVAAESMKRRLVDDGESEDEAWQAVLDFLDSEEATIVRFNEISAALYAGISKKIADEGQKESIHHAHNHDIEGIAAYLPYCTAMTVDGYFEELLRKPNISRTLGGSTKFVFSVRQRHQLLEYLHKLEDEASKELKDTVIAVYGGSWLQPFETILEYHRERAAQQRSR